MSYARFAAMIATSTAVMFGLMYLNTYALDHVAFSETRAFMALVMGAVMAALMLGFMWGMYPNRRATSLSSWPASPSSLERSLWCEPRRRSGTWRTCGR